MTNTSPQHLTLIVGGTGKTGRRVAERLTALGMPVRLGSRSAEVPFDWTDPTTWDAALRGVESAYVTYYPDLAMPGAADAIRTFCELAVDSGLRRLVLLSGRGEPEAQRCEQIVQSYPLESTCVRASMFSQNFDEYFLVDAVRSGVVAFPGRTTPEPFIDVEDIADVVVAALTEDGHAGQVYEVTGPRLLTFAEAIGEIEAASGRPVRYLPVSRDEYVTSLVDEADVPEPDAQFLGDLFDAVLDGRNAYVTNGVERAIGRPARDFADYAQAAASTGVWSA
ncbi:MAG TPA: NmrA family NAD(P)-binding protein [Nocardioidaceae bacterium]|nr:NmrA family NAD(P)-binding protein [Nocardioidaceae bacterium]